MVRGILESLVPWENSFLVTEKFVWVRVRGLPLVFWSRQCFELIETLVRTLVEVDEAIVAQETLEFARLRIRILMEKWIWRMSYSKGGLWKEVLDSKYGGWRNLKVSKTNKNESLWWRELKEIWLMKK